MKSFELDDCLNYYQEGNLEVLFQDLSDMEEFNVHFQQAIESGQLRFSVLPGTGDLFIVCMSDALQGFFDAIVVFSKTPSISVATLVVLKKNRIVGNDQYIYSVGYHVNKELRGQGLARGIVEQAKARAQEFFEEFGPRYDRGPDKSYRYTLESVVATGNQASNRIASTLLHSGEPISTGIELRSGEPSNVYRLTL